LSPEAVGRLRRKTLHGLATCAFVLVTTTGCWEQWSEDWFPQMKWQKAVQAFESTGFERAPTGFGPAPGAIPTTGKDPEIGRMDVAAADALANPRDPRDFRSLENGRVQYETYCAVCHGSRGMGDGPVSLSSPKKGPFAGVFPLVGLVTARSDGFLYNVIRIGSGGFPGFRMPSYKRIPPQDRWDIVNYVRFLDSKGGNL
jgi:mono/diheme cytochrome c family protein